MASLLEWCNSIDKIAVSDLEEEGADPGLPIKISNRQRIECTAAWERTKDAMSRFRTASGEEFFRLAERLYDRTRSWADDVFDGLWPSTHVDADQHDDLWELESALFEYASIDLRVGEEELVLRCGRTWREHATKLGGSGKRF
jgi:hypothetical protein